MRIYIVMIIRCGFDGLRAAAIGGGRWRTTPWLLVQECTYFTTSQKKIQHKQGNSVCCKNDSFALQSHFNKWHKGRSIRQQSLLFVSKYIEAKAFSISADFSLRRWKEWEAMRRRGRLSFYHMRDWDWQLPQSPCLLPLLKRQTTFMQALLPCGDCVEIALNSPPITSYFSLSRAEVVIIGGSGFGDCWLELLLLPSCPHQYYSSLLT